MSRWYDTAKAAVADVASDLEADGFVLCQMSDGHIAEPPEGSSKNRRYLHVTYSEARDQYRCTVQV
jgi:hypothetical protein